MVGAAKLVRQDDQERYKRIRQDKHDCSASNNPMRAANAYGDVNHRCFFYHLMIWPKGPGGDAPALEVGFKRRE